MPRPFDWTVCLNLTGKIKKKICSNITDRLRWNCRFFNKRFDKIKWSSKFYTKAVEFKCNNLLIYFRLEIKFKLMVLLRNFCIMAMECFKQLPYLIKNSKMSD